MKPAACFEQAPWASKPAALQASKMRSLFRFTCNVCNSQCRAETLDREIPSCKCGSNVRFRWIVHALSTELFGESLPLKKFPRDRNIRGISLSDWEGIAKVLAKRFDYQNTFLHRKPVLDIMDLKSGADARYDFMVASEVLEHVPPPVQNAFDNIARLLKPNGFAVFSSPWNDEGDTIEHFPALHDWQVFKFRATYVLLNRTKEGQLEAFENLAFHNGPGNILETRVFSIDGLMANCKAAGLEMTMAEDYLAYGIAWDPWSKGIVLRKIKSNA
jgi:SAM-dependent methyltransferase